MFYSMYCTLDILRIVTITKKKIGKAIHLITQIL